MDEELDKGSKKFCIRGKHVAMIVAAVVVVGLAVGLGVGLTYPEPCKSTNGGDATTKPTSSSTTSTSSSTTSTTTAPSESEACPVKDDNSGAWKNFRLPSHIRPLHYDLEIQPEMDKDTYHGTVTIWLKLTSSDKHLWLHIRENKISGQPKLKDRTGQEIQLIQCFEYRPQEYVVMEFTQQLPANADDDNLEDTYRLTLQFAGQLNGSLVGFYRTTYQENGVTKSIAATDHEPTDARKSFPCFDEPNQKATYSITIIHPSDYKAISNMPSEASTDLGNGWIKTVFQKSVPMSTYLVAFAVHQFTYVERFSKRGIPLRIYVQPNQNETALYAAETTKIIFDFFEEYFDMTYSLPKLDQIAIPDFGTGAMENWGLITYRETNLLYDPAESATVNKQRVAAVIAHELVHQWFGNIVTMDWWDDLWLNEGFASFFEYVGVKEAEPTWNMLDQILIDDLLPVMRDDALLSSHPIIVSVSTPAEITSVFDAISYNKGASILRMLEEWITPESFQLGCQNYLKDYNFKNAKTDDFWNSLAKASGKPVKEVMDTWTRQMGYPVLIVSSGNTVTQERFLLDHTADPSLPSSIFNYKWNIPVTFYSTSNATGLNSLMFNLADASLTLSPYNSSNAQFFKINNKHFGFFRVNYEAQTWKDLATLLESSHEDFSAGDRAGLIDDVFALASSEWLDYNISLDLTKYLKKEKDYLPWQRMNSALSYLNDMLEDDATIYPKFQEYWRRQVKPITDHLGWSDTGTDIEKLLRSLVLAIACKMEDPDALNNASSLFNDWKSDKVDSLAVNLRQLVYRYGMKQADDEASWNFMFQKYQETTLAQEKEKLLQGLASANSIPLLDTYLKYIYNTDLIKSQDALNVIYYIAVYSKLGKQMAWDWVRINWDYLVNRYTINDRNLGRIVTRISGTFNTEAQLWQMRNFFERYPNAGAGETPRKQALETARNNIEWVTNNKNGIKSWLDQNVVP
ncbi:PREDICTED: glutamyl aminopeptidase [Nanorana parkeri]|uniref:glutamyl aminopeptidase n=1 Tax=Nanorana parkeri TaxID=125878 RepID=UPI000854B9DF|nr:PREDICTED: glutamyl aminopeptidase [Nanorana parkeri]